MNFSRMSAIAIKEAKQLLRDRITFGMVVMIPLIQLLLFGFAINTNVRQIPVAAVDLSQSAAGHIIIEDAKASDVVHFEYFYSSIQQAEQAITAGKVRAALILPADLSKRLANGETAGQWIVDGSDTLVSSAILQLRAMPLPHHKQSTKSQAPNFEVALYFNPERRSAVNIVPGLLGVILTMTMILFTSAAIVRERERGNMELLITTPIRPLELMIAKILPYIVVGYIQVAIILSLGHLIFKVPITGSIIQIILSALVFISASLTLGLLISTIASTQLQAMQLTVFILLPSILLSGFIFPFEAMPRLAQWIAEVLPATHFIRMIRGVVLRGGSVVDMLPDTLFLLAFTCLGLLAASLRFKKNLD